jgi:hypothetical protein
MNKMILKSLQLATSLAISFSFLSNENTNCQGTHSPPDVPNDTAAHPTPQHTFAFFINYKEVVGMQMNLFSQ